MKNYFQIQFQLFRRELLARAISPRLVLLVLVVGFIPFSNYLFENLQQAAAVYLALQAGILLQLNTQKRHAFYRAIFPPALYTRIRLTENLLLSAPFVLYLAIQSHVLYALAATVLAVMLSFFRASNPSNIVLPTPFNPVAFEFIRGFRKTFLLFALAYALAFIANLSNNPNLGVAAVLLPVLISMSYFNYREPAYFIWIQSASPGDFLIRKATTSSIYAALLAAPAFIILAFGHLRQFDMFLLALLLGLAFLWGVIFAKYASFPLEISIPHSMMIALCIMLPPLILVIAYFLYKKAVATLNALNND